MSKLSSLTNMLTGASDESSKGLFHLHLPESSLGGILPVTKETDITSLGELTSALSDTIGNLNQIGHMAYCLGELIKDPSMMLGILDNISNSLLAVAFDMADRLASVIQGQILGIMGSVVGSAINLITSILDFLTAILRIYNSLVEIWENLKNRAMGNWDDFMSKEQCEQMFAQIASCMLNKLYGDKLAKFEEKVTSKITEAGQSIHSSITDGLADVNSLSNYVRHESFLMNKANEQLQLFS